MDIEVISITTQPRKLNVKWSVERNPCGEIDLNDSTFCILGKNDYDLLEVTVNSYGQKIYSVSISEPVDDWLRQTYVEGVDYLWVRSLKGMWVDVSEEIFVVLKLKWA